MSESSLIRETLKNSDLFSGLSDDQLDKLLPLCREVVHEPGDVIFHQGEPCHAMHVVESGKVVLETGVRIGRAAEGSAAFEVISPCGLLCCSGLIDPNILTATGRTLEKTQLVSFSAGALEALLQQEPEFGLMVMKNLAKVVFERLQSTRDTMGRILSIIFHDLKAPLAAVEDYNRLLLGEYIGELNEEQKDMLQRSSKRLADLLNLVSNMLDLSRIDFGDLRTAEVSMTALLESCLDVMGPLAREKGVQLVNELPPQLPPILGTEDRLKQVITNLLSNAIKFTPSGGKITVKGEEDIEEIRIKVADTGIGISTEELGKIFDAFYQGLSVSERGTGLGLSITKKIVEAHHGRIWAVSPCAETGRGSEFIFTLPRIE